MISINDYLEEAKLRMAAEKSLYEFTKQAWHVVESEPFVDNWHVRDICEHLEACMRRDIRRLLINAPPRSLKTLLLSVMLPAYRWLTHSPERFMYVSYGSDLSNENSRRCRQVLQSLWYQMRWGHLYKIVSDQNAKERFDNDKNGYRIATSITASSTGFGADVIVFDDANNAKDMESKVSLEKTNSIFSGAFSTRFNNLERSVLICNQQRIAELDLSGYIIANDFNNDWVKLILPLEFEKKRCAVTVPLAHTGNKPWRDPRKIEGEPLCKTRFPPAAIKDLKAGLGSEYRIAGQLQQRPSPAEGGLLKRNWFKWWAEEKPPEIFHVIQSWDTAMTEKKSGCYSACTTWGLFYDENGNVNIILIELYRAHLDFPDLLDRAERLHKDWRDTGKDKLEVKDAIHRSDLVIVEYQVSGISLLQALRKRGIPIRGFNPRKHGGEKDLRVKLISHFIEGGRVWVRARKPNFVTLTQPSETLVECAALYPAGDSKDVIDTLAQVLHSLKHDALLSHPNDEVSEEYTRNKKKGHGYW